MAKKLNKKGQRAYLLNRVGESVNFKYPEPPHHLKGKLLDRHVVLGGEDEWVVYWNMIDLIEFEGEDENWLRITYYRYKKKEKRWVFAGQTSYTDPISQFIELVAGTARKKKWMRDILEEVSKAV